MLKRNDHHITSSSGRRGAGIAAAAAVLLAALAAAGCGPDKEAVCPEKDEHLVLVPSTSVTDYDVSIELTPAVSRQVVRRAATSCGELTVGIQDNRPAANLELRSKALIPEDKTAYNSESKTDRLVEDGDAFVEENLIGPLDAAGPSEGSPFLSTLVKVGEERVAHGWGPLTIVLVGDGLVVERPPEGGELIRFWEASIPEEAVAAFVPLLEPLKGSCVVLVGAGATSKIPDQRIRTSQLLLDETLAEAGVGFVATRSPDLPEGC